MSQNLSTALRLGAKTPFILVMQLDQLERRCFIDNLLRKPSDSLKRSVLF